ncbi:TetR/AcrR family transcriptional regulator [Streptomyces sp. CAU 1734]|uniref:TetR/AcrR family transcriptional regulator n=1 Tax=Streptomyces sp. CAU 1734 TaxID=3140360 RepID=UPI00326025D5
MQTRTQRHGTPAADEDRPGTRERIVRAASALMQRQGYEGTGIKQISQRAEATLGSVYHFFPGGKQELAVAAVHRGDEEFSGVLGELLDSEPDPGAAIGAVARSLAESLRASEWADGCPVTATALGTAARFPDIREAAAEAFTRWQGLVGERLRAAGIDDRTADELASTVISTLEGAEFAAQVARDERALLLAGVHLDRLVSLHLPD